MVYCEQGFGDILQFCRYFRVLKENGCQVTVHTPKEMHGILSHVPGVDFLLSKDEEKLPEHDYHIPSMSLPFLLRQADVVENSPYVRFEGRMDLGEISGYKIGIAWEGNPEHSNNEERNCPLRAFRPIFELQEVKVFMLQKEIHSPELIEGAEDLELLGSELDDFLDTASLINAMDLVVSVDTCVLHLSSCLKKPTIGLLSAPCDARWAVKNWYSSLKLVQQETPGDWESLLKSVADRIRDSI